MKKNFLGLAFWGCTLLLGINTNVALNEESKKDSTSVMLENIEALACTLFEDFGPQGELWCNCDNMNYECGTHYYPNYEVVYGRPEVRW